MPPTPYRGLWPQDADADANLQSNLSVSVSQSAATIEWISYHHQWPSLLSWSSLLLAPALLLFWFWISDSNRSMCVSLNVRHSLSACLSLLWLSVWLNYHHSIQPSMAVVVIASDGPIWCSFLSTSQLNSNGNSSRRTAATTSCESSPFIRLWMGHRQHLIVLSGSTLLCSSFSTRLPQSVDGGGCVTSGGENGATLAVAVVGADNV